MEALTAKKAQALIDANDDLIRDVLGGGQFWHLRAGIIDGTVDIYRFSGAPASAEALARAKALGASYICTLDDGETHLAYGDAGLGWERRHLVIVGTQGE